MTILITGANRGVGAELRRQMLARGDKVTGTTRAAPSDGMLKLDVTDAGAHRVMARSWGNNPLELLVCNAGVYLDKRRYIGDEVSVDDWAATFAANVTGVMLTVEAMLPALEHAKSAGGTPKIAIIGSQMGARAKAGGGSYAYRASKAAVINLAFNLAHDLRDKGIAVGVYHPGWVRTDMGGDGGTVSVEQSASHLIDRFDALSMATTGEFLTLEGAPHDL